MSPSGLGGDPPDPRAIPSGCPFHPALCPSRRDECTTSDRRALAGRRRAGAAACVHVSTGGRVSERRCSRCAASTSTSRGAKGAVARAVDGVDLERARGRGARARRRVGLRQDDARAHDHRASSARPRARCVSGASRSRYDDALAAARTARQVQMVFQDPTGALNPRQTIYEAVAEGLRIQKLSEGRGRRGRRRAVARRPAAARALLRRSTRTRSRAASASAS